MRLPKGVYFHPKQKRLISKDELAIILIDTSIPNNANYTIQDRLFKEGIAPYLHGDWKKINRLFDLAGECGSEKSICSEASHIGRSDNIKQLKLPNITVIPNIPITHLVL